MRKIVITIGVLVLGVSAFGQLSNNAFNLNNDYGDLNMRRFIDGDLIWKRALVSNETILKINHNGDFTEGTRIMGTKLIIDGNVGVGTNNPTATFQINKSGTIGGVWKPNNSFLTLNDNNGSSLLMDTNEIYGSNTLHIGTRTGDIIKFRSITDTSHSDKVVIKADGKVGIGTNNPSAMLHVAQGSQLRKTAIGLTTASAENGWIRDEWLTGSYGPAKWDQNSKKWIRPGGTYNDIGGIVYQDEGTYFLREKAGTKLEYTNGEFLNTAFMFAHIATGNVGIGTTDTKGYKLGVKGKIAAEEVKVALYNNWPDYVFEESYNLPTLQQVEAHISENGHLINIPSAAEVEENGILLGEMNAKLLEKIEELTLYTIAQEKQLKTQEEKIKNQESRNTKLETKNTELEARLAKIEALLSGKK